jgi:hypothetical protein
MTKVSGKVNLFTFYLLPFLVSVGFVNNEAENLALLDVVETYNTNVVSRILRTARLNFAQYFTGGSSAEQRQLPQCPVELGGFRNFVELDRRNVTLRQNVLNLLFDLSVVQGGKIRKGLVAALFW